MANSTVATVSPSAQPTQNTVAMAQEVLQQGAQLAQAAIVACLGFAPAGSSPRSRRLRRKAQSVTACQHAEHDQKQRADLLGGGEAAQELVHVSARYTSAQGLRASHGRRPARAVQEGAALFASTPARIGAPKVTEHRMGTGTTSPLGMTRCTLLIHAGTSTTAETSGPG
jgi:hypothetical protein